MTWSLGDIGDQTGRTVLVTGPSPNGLGHHVALELARRGARVVLAGRDPAKLAATADLVGQQVPGARVDRLELDLAELASVRRAAAKASALGPIHVLVNNAGVMAPRTRGPATASSCRWPPTTSGRSCSPASCCPSSSPAGDGRVVTVSSNGHRMTRSTPVDDPLTSPRHYQRWPQYAATKLANLLFTYELDRRLREAGLPVRALAAHPGFAGTHLVVNGQLGRAVGWSGVDPARGRAGGLPVPRRRRAARLMAATATCRGRRTAGRPGRASGAALPRSRRPALAPTTARPSASCGTSPSAPSAWPTPDGGPTRGPGSLGSRPPDA